MKKTILVSWSGGLDSTYLIYKYLEEGHNVKAFYTKLMNNEEKTAYELEAISKLSVQFSMRYLKRFQYKPENSEIYVRPSDYKGNSSPLVLSQPPIWLLSLVFAIDESVDEIAIGYVMNDCAISFLPDIQRMYRTFQPFMEDKLPKLVFPLIKMSKEDLFKLLPKEYYDNTVTCEQPIKLISLNGTYTPCYFCSPCKHKMEFDSAYKKSGNDCVVVSMPEKKELTLFDKEL